VGKSAKTLLGSQNVLPNVGQQPGAAPLLLLLLLLLLGSPAVAAASACCVHRCARLSFKTSTSSDQATQEEHPLQPR
jgi:hypothetical protein